MRETGEGGGVSKAIASNPTNGFSSNWQSEHRLGASLGVHVKDLFTSVFKAESILAHVDVQTEAVIPSMDSIDAIVGSNSSVSTGGPLHSACLGARPGRVRAPVLSMGNPEVRVIGLDLDALDGLDRVRNVCVVDERAVPGEDNKDTASRVKMGKVSLFFQEVDEFDITILAKVPLQPLLTEGVEVLNIPDIHVPRCTRVDGERESWREWARVLTPADLQPTVVKGQALVGSDLVERHSSSRVDEGNELSKPPSGRVQGMEIGGIHTAMCLSCMYLMLCNTPPLIALHRSSAVVSGWMFPR